MSFTARSILMRSARIAGGILASSLNINPIASVMDNLSRFIDRGLRRSVGESSSDFNGGNSKTSALRFGFFAIAGAASPRSPEPEARNFFWANSTAPQTLSRCSGVTTLFGQDWRSRSATFFPKRGWRSRTPPARTNCTGLPDFTNFLAQRHYRMPWPILGGSDERFGLASEKIRNARS